MMQGVIGIILLFRLADDLERLKKLRENLAKEISDKKQNLQVKLPLKVLKRAETARNCYFNIFQFSDLCAIKLQFLFTKIFNLEIKYCIL